MRSAKLGLVVLAVAAFTLVTSPARVQSSNRFSSRTCEESTDIVNNSCTGEAILVQAETCTSLVITQDQAGGFHLQIHQETHGTGVGITSGNEYVINDVANQELNTKSLQLEENVVEDSLLISQGPAPNEIVRLSTHFTVNANGDITVFRTSFEIECKG
jgi:hypothetical protein